MTNLATKYRPSILSEVVGQFPIKTSLETAIKENKIANAYIFTGKRGVGKTSTARILAKSLNCEAGVTTNPCGECSNCKSIESSNNLDVVELDAASNSGVDAVREICQRSSYSSVHSLYKIYIIDEAHCLSSTAQNALLKTIEEPTSYVTFILCTTEPEKLLDTVQSRCHVMSFQGLSDKLVTKTLSHIANQENIFTDSLTLRKVTRLAKGSLRDAIKALEQIDLLKGDYSHESLASFFNEISDVVLTDLVTAIATSDVATALTILRKLFDEGNKCVTIVASLSRIYVDILVAYRCPERLEFTELEPEAWQRILTLSKAFTPLSLLKAQEAIRNTAAGLLTSAYGTIYVESLVISLIELANTDNKLSW